MDCLKDLKEILSRTEKLNNIENLVLAHEKIGRLKEENDKLKNEIHELKEEIRFYLYGQECDSNCQCCLHNKGSVFEEIERTLQDKK